MTTGTITGVCSGIFTDSNNGTFGSGGTGNYANNENYTMTFCSGSNQHMTFVFNSLVIKSGDYLRIYDGPSNSSPLLYEINNSSMSNLMITSSGNCITFHFTSDNSGGLFSSNGNWEASFFCGDLNTNLLASDNCSSATMICDLSNYVGNTSSSYTVDKPGNMCESCSLFLGSLENNSWIKFIAENDTVTFTLKVLACANDVGIQFGVYQATNCNNFVLMTSSQWTSASSPMLQGSTSLITATGLVPGNEYYIMIDGNAGDNCFFVINAQSGIQLGATINPPNQTICYGENATITINSSSNATVNWTASPPDPSLIGQQNNLQITVSPTQTTTYTATYHATSGYCLFDTVFTSIVNVLPQTDPTCNNTITCSISKTDATTCPSTSNHQCDGTAIVTVNGSSGPFQYLWSDNNNQPIRNNLCAGLYTVTVIDPVLPNGVTTCSVIINGPMAPIISLVPINTCSNEATGSISVSVISGTPPYQYLWNNGVTTEDISNLWAGNYSLTVTDNNNCKAVASATVGEYPSLNISISPTNATVCQGDSLQLTASGGSLYLWSGPGVFQETGNSITVIVTGNSTYSVTVIDANSCKTTSTVSVNVYSNPIIQAYCIPTTICEGESTTIYFSASGGLQPYSFTVNGVSAISPFTITSDVSTSYLVEVTDACMSKDSKILPLIVYPLPDVNIEAKPSSGCVPLKVNLIEIANDTALSWEWTINNIPLPHNNRSLSFLFNDEGFYDVKLKVTSMHGCENTLVLDDFIKVYSNPTADFTILPERYTTLQNNVSFKNNSIGYNRLIWNFGDSTFAYDVENPQHQYNVDSSLAYTVCLIAINDKGCSDLICKELKFDYEPVVYLPNAFTPNNDGKNEEFGLYGWDIDKEFYDFTIYNRWGEIVFHTQDFNLKWDGKRNGIDCQQGVYVWLIRYKEINGQIRLISGWVNLIR